MRVWVGDLENSIEIKIVFRVLSCFSLCENQLNLCWSCDNAVMTKVKKKDLLIFLLLFIALALESNSLTSNVQIAYIFQYTCR